VPAIPVRDLHAHTVARDWPDGALILAVFVATLTYAALIPPFIGASDEANYLHMAKRVADGEVLYRDIFELTTPGWIYFVALLYRLFGADVLTVKTAAALIHALSTVGLFLSCRAAGVRRGLSWPMPLAYLILCIPAFPFASQHWLTGLLNILLLLVCLTRARGRAAWPLIPGVLVGLLIGVHQRGALMGAAVAVWLIVDAWLTTAAGDGSAAARRNSAIAALKRAATDLGWFAAGALCILIPLGIVLVATAGAEPVWRALVVHPLVNYRGAHRCRWGHIPTLGKVPVGLPVVLKYLPVGLVIPALRLVTHAVRRRWHHNTGTLVLLLITNAGAIASIWYFPDYIHIAFIAPLMFVTIAESLEWGLTLLRVPSLVWRRVGMVGAAAVLIAGAWPITRTINAWRTMFSARADTAFGRVAIAPNEQVFLDELVQLLRDAPERSLFGYPVSASRLSLMTGATNPTRYAFFRFGYNAPDQLQDLMASLSANPPTYVIRHLLGLWFKRKNDPIEAFIDQHFEPVDPKHPLRSLILKPRKNSPAAL
jgi:hypothetical protein